MSNPVLIVDDDANLLATLRIALEDEGYEVLVAEDGLAALDLLEDAEPALILLDLVMPRMDGAQFIQEVERRGLRARAPILVLSAAGRADEHTADLQADGFLEKPFDLDNLLTHIARLTR